MVGGLIQLVEIDQENNPLIQNPTLNFFKKVYKKHTPFAHKSLELNFHETTKFGATCSCTIKPHGDLIFHTYLIIDLPEIKSKVQIPRYQQLENLYKSIFKKVPDNIVYFEKIRYQMKKLELLRKYETNQYFARFDSLVEVWKSRVRIRNPVSLDTIDGDIVDFGTETNHTWVIITFTEPYQPMENMEIMISNHWFHLTMILSEDTLLRHNYYFDDDIFAPWVMTTFLENTTQTFEFNKNNFRISFDSFQKQNEANSIEKQIMIDFFDNRKQIENQILIRSHDTMDWYLKQFILNQNFTEEPLYTSRYLIKELQKKLSSQLIKNTETKSINDIFYQNLVSKAEINQYLSNKRTIFALVTPSIQLSYQDTIHISNRDFSVVDTLEYSDTHTLVTIDFEDNMQTLFNADFQHLDQNYHIEQLWINIFSNNLITDAEIWNRPLEENDVLMVNQTFELWFEGNLTETLFQGTNDLRDDVQTIMTITIQSMQYDYASNNTIVTITPNERRSTDYSLIRPNTMVQNYPVVKVVPDYSNQTSAKPMLGRVINIMNYSDNCLLTLQYLEGNFNTLSYQTTLSKIWNSEEKVVLDNVANLTTDDLISSTEGIYAVSNVDVTTKQVELLVLHSFNILSQGSSLINLTNNELMTVISVEKINSEMYSNTISTQVMNTEMEYNIRELSGTVEPMIDTFTNIVEENYLFFNRFIENMFSLSNLAYVGRFVINTIAYDEAEYQAQLWNNFYSMVGTYETTNQYMSMIEQYFLQFREATMDNLNNSLFQQTSYDEETAIKQLALTLEYLEKVNQNIVSNQQIMDLTNLTKNYAETSLLVSGTTSTFYCLNLLYLHLNHQLYTKMLVFSASEQTVSVWETIVSELHSTLHKKINQRITDATFRTNHLPTEVSDFIYFYHDSHYSDMVYTESILNHYIERSLLKTNVILTINMDVNITEEMVSIFYPIEGAKPIHVIVDQINLADQVTTITGQIWNVEDIETSTSSAILLYNNSRLPIVNIEYQGTMPITSDDINQGLQTELYLTTVQISELRNQYNLDMSVPVLYQGDVYLIRFNESYDFDQNEPMRNNIAKFIRQSMHNYTRVSNPYYQMLHYMDDTNDRYCDLMKNIWNSFGKTGHIKSNYLTKLKQNQHIKMENYRQLTINSLSKSILSSSNGTLRCFYFSTSSNVNINDSLRVFYNGIYTYYRIIDVLEINGINQVKVVCVNGFDQALLSQTSIEYSNGNDNYYQPMDIVFESYVLKSWTNHERNLNHYDHQPLIQNLHYYRDNYRILSIDSAPYDYSKYYSTDVSSMKEKFMNSVQTDGIINPVFSYQDQPLENNYFSDIFNQELNLVFDSNLETIETYVSNLTVQYKQDIKWLPIMELLKSIYQRDVEQTISTSTDVDYKGIPVSQSEFIELQYKIAYLEQLTFQEYTLETEIESMTKRLVIAILEHYLNQDLQQNLIFHDIHELVNQLSGGQYRYVEHAIVTNDEYDSIMNQNSLEKIGNHYYRKSKIRNFDYNAGVLTRKNYDSYNTTIDVIKTCFKTFPALNVSLLRNCFTDMLGNLQPFVDIDDFLMVATTLENNFEKVGKAFDSYGSVFAYHNFFSNNVITKNEFLTRIRDDSKYYDISINEANELSEIYTTYERYRENIATILYPPDSAKTAFGWKEMLAHRMVEAVEFKVGNQTVHSLDRDLIHVNHQLYFNPRHQKGYERMIGNIYELTTIDTLTKPRYRLYLPLPFFYTTEIGNAFPIAATPNVNISIEIRFAPQNACIKIPIKEDLSFKAKIMVDYIFLDNAERRELQEKKRDYLIHQHQKNPISILDRMDNTIPLTFTKVCSEIIWTLQMEKQYLSGNIFDFTDNHNNILKKGKIKILGQDLTRWLEHDVFETLVPYSKYRRVPTGVGVHCFSLYPLDTQPSGGLNFSSVSDANIRLVLDEHTNVGTNNRVIFKAWAKSYNLLRVMSGMASIVNTG